MRTVLAVVLLLTLTACSGGDEPSSGPTPSSTTDTPPPPSATPVAVPRDRACYRLDYDEAVAPTNDAEPVDCHTRHTSMTYSVGKLERLIDGRLPSVDSGRVRRKVAESCPARFADFVGGSLEDRRLSMLRPVWFTPTIEEFEGGASWYRCDVIALARDQELARLTGALSGVLDTDEGRDRFGMCGTAEPGTRGFARVICSTDHSWRAIATVPFPDGSYPGLEQVREAGQQPCEDAGRGVADDALNFQWGYEWPTAAQWKAGQHYGICWAPD